MDASGNSSTCVFHSGAPVRALTACIHECRSLIYAVCPSGEMMMAGSYAVIGFIGPVDAAALGIQRIDRPVGAADKKPSAVNCGRAERGGYAWKSEGPFQLELGDILTGKSGGFGRLKAAIRCIDAPGVPRSCAFRKSGRTGAMGGLRNRFGALGPQVFRHASAVGGAESCTDGAHFPGLEGGENRLPGQAAEGGRAGRIGRSVAVTGGAQPLKNRRSILSVYRGARKQSKYKNPS